MKTIVICGQEYNIDCNAYTRFQFHKIFKRGIIEDIQIIQEFFLRQTILTQEILKKDEKITENDLIKKLSNSLMATIDDYIDAVTRITYICIVTVDSNFMSYEEWLKTIEKINTNDIWIAEVTELAVNCFC